MAVVKFPLKEIRERAVGNAGALWYTTIVYLKSKGLSAEEWIDGVGKLYAPGWVGVKGQGALTVLREAAAEWVSCGATCFSLEGDEKRAEAVIQWPPEGFSGISITEAQAVNNVFHPITAAVGLKCSWKSEGENFRLIFYKE